MNIMIPEAEKIRLDKINYKYILRQNLSCNKQIEETEIEEYDYGR